MSQHEDFVRAIAHCGEKVRQIRDDQWTNDTPCTEWDVRALLRHVVYEIAWVPDLLAGETVAEVGDRYDGDILGDDPKTAFEEVAARAGAAVSLPGALDGDVSVSSGRMPASGYVAEVFNDLVIHGWDLARGIGVDDAMEPAFVEQLYARLAPHEAALKASGAWGPMIVPPPGADLQTRFLAITGRVQ